MKRPSISIAVVLILTGCATYTTPGAGVAIPNLAAADADVQSVLETEPASPFPARLAIVRVQGSGYQSLSNTCYGTGGFCVITTLDVEEESAFTALSRLPQVLALARMNRLLIPAQLSSTRDLRLAAAGLKADLVLLYSLDTSFNVDSTDIGPLALISLGFVPNKKAHVTSVSSAAIIDVRTGFIYGLAEATAREDQRATVWSTSAAIDEARQRAEREAFANLIVEIEKLWTSILQTHAPGRS